MTETAATDALPTRPSLVARLADASDDPAWRQFVDTYYDLIYRIARRSGLDDGAAREVTQDTCVTVAQAMPQFRYQPERCAFRSWLHTVTRRRVVDYLRRQRRGPLAHAAALDADAQERIADDADPGADWDAAWREEALALALERTKAQVSPIHYQIFECSSVRGWRPAEVARTLDVGIAQVYLARHRVGKVVQAEIQKLEADGW